MKATQGMVLLFLLLLFLLLSGWVLMVVGSQGPAMGWILGAIAFSSHPRIQGKFLLSAPMLRSLCIGNQNHTWYFQVQYSKYSALRRPRSRAHNMECQRSRRVCANYDIQNVHASPTNSIYDVQWAVSLLVWSLPYRS